MKSFALERGLKVGPQEIRALEQQGLTALYRQGVGHAVAEIQLGRVTAALAEVDKGLTGDPRLILREGDDLDVQHSYELVEIAESHRTALTVDHHARFKIGRRRHSHPIRISHPVGERFVSRLGAKDGDQCGRIHDHLGIPWSS